MVNFFQGDLGLSFTQYPNTVGQLILERLPRTVTLFLTATLLSYYLGFGLGKIMAWKRGRSFETALTLGGVAGYTVFYPWFAILMLWLFGFALELVPAREVHRCPGVDRGGRDGQPALHSDPGHRGIRQCPGVGDSHRVPAGGQ